MVYRSRGPGDANGYPAKSMAPTLFRIDRGQHPRTFFVEVSLRGNAPSRFAASIDDSNSDAVSCNIESELFFALSEAGNAKFGDCSVYQIELMSIIKAFAKDELDLALPATLGTTDYCWKKPSLLCAIWNKLVGRLTMMVWKLGVKRPGVKLDADTISKPGIRCED